MAFSLALDGVSTIRQKPREVRLEHHMRHENAEPPEWRLKPHRVHHARAARGLWRKVVIVDEGAEGALDHLVAEVARALEGRDAGAVPLADSEVAPLERDRVIQFQKRPALGVLHHTLSGVNHRLGVEGHVAREIKAGLWRGADSCHDADSRHRWYGTEMNSRSGSFTAVSLPRSGRCA